MESDNEKFAACRLRRFFATCWSSGWLTVVMVGCSEGVWLAAGGCLFLVHSPSAGRRLAAREAPEGPCYRSRRRRGEAIGRHGGREGGPGKNGQQPHLTPGICQGRLWQETSGQLFFIMA